MSTYPYPAVEVVVTVASWSEGFGAVADTGFEGAISLPASVLKEIELQPYKSRVLLPDGHLALVPTWLGSIELEGRWFRCEVIATGSSCLLGREILDQCEVCFLFGKEVRIRFE
jgi:predicted aspartyl protease